LLGGLNDSCIELLGGLNDSCIELLGGLNDALTSWSDSTYASWRDE
jgi:hypothetical protein